MLLKFCAGAIALAGSVAAHGGAHQQPIQVEDDANWATRHMAEEHHISNFDPGSFFVLHDFDSNGHWDRNEIMTFYGLRDESNKDVPASKREEVVKRVLELADADGNGEISRDEWMAFCKDKGELPDFGLGPGHHGDDEYEYEIHHWEKYHDENTKEEDLVHPEDIAHFKKHDEEDDEADRVAELDKMKIVEANIPSKFRRS